MKLKRTKQCAKCPWLVDTDPHDIPANYAMEQREALKETIADPGLLAFHCSKVMHCQEHNSDEEVFCIGWLWNQLGQGNNVGLKMHMYHYENAKEIEVIGEQHQNFQDTLP